MEPTLKYVWVFNGVNSNFPSGVFTNRATAEEWIARYKLTGTLTLYPLNRGAYDWAIDNQLFSPKRPEHESPTFIGGFSSASFEHYHYEDGVCD